MTETERKALTFIKDHPDCSARRLAEHMWPGSPMHTQVRNQGNGACAGKAAWLCGGSLAGKLRKKGWILFNTRLYSSYNISKTGEEALKNG